MNSRALAHVVAVGTFVLAACGDKAATAAEATPGETITVDVPNGRMLHSMFLAVRGASGWSFDYALTPARNGEEPRVRSIDSANIDMPLASFEAATAEIQMPEDLAPGDVMACIEPEITDECVRIEISE